MSDHRTVTDDDLERAVRDLTRHCGDGRLTLDELEDRITEVHAATTGAELALAFRELPSFRLTPGEPAPDPAPATPRRPDPAPRPAPARRTRPAAVARCGHRGMAKPPVVLLALAGLLVVTAHFFWAIVLLCIALPRLNRTHARA